jgi:hypothetical protein
MPRFFFYIIDGEETLEDPDGTELADLEAARLDALQSARHLLAEKVKNGEVVDGQKFEIRDGDGNLLAIVPFRDALRLS